MSVDTEIVAAVMGRVPRLMPESQWHVAASTIQHWVLLSRPSNVETAMVSHSSLIRYLVDCRAWTDRTRPPATNVVLSPEAVNATVSWWRHQHTLNPTTITTIVSIVRTVSKVLAVPATQSILQRKQQPVTGSVRTSPRIVAEARRWFERVSREPHDPAAVYTSYVQRFGRTSWEQLQRPALVTVSSGFSFRVEAAGCVVPNQYSPRPTSTASTRTSARAARRALQTPQPIVVDPAIEAAVLSRTPRIPTDRWDLVRDVVRAWVLNGAPSSVGSAGRAVSYAADYATWVITCTNRDLTTTALSDPVLVEDYVSTLAGPANTIATQASVLRTIATANTRGRRPTNRQPRTPIAQPFTALDEIRMIGIARAQRLARTRVELAAMLTFICGAGLKSAQLRDVRPADIVTVTDDAGNELWAVHVVGVAQPRMIRATYWPLLADLIRWHVEDLARSTNDPFITVPEKRRKEVTGRAARRATDSSGKGWDFSPYRMRSTWGPVE